MRFITGRKYLRADVKEAAGLPRGAKGGNWDTGVVEHGGELIIFANVGVEGRTGHNYGNQWEGQRLRWYHKNGSHIGWASVQRMLEPTCVIHVFWRSSNNDSFQYAGQARPVEIRETSPVEILWTFDGPTSQSVPISTPDELPLRRYREGAVHTVQVNAYERDRTARQVCIAYYGARCAVCGFSFEEQYGELGAGFIHVHHLVPLAEVGTEYEVNPLKDLRPVCPNCHAMLHRKQPALTITELKERIATMKGL